MLRYSNILLYNLPTIHPFSYILNRQALFSIETTILHQPMLVIEIKSIKEYLVYCKAAILYSHPTFTMASRPLFQVVI